MRRTSSSLDSHMRAQINVVLPRVGNIMLDQCTRYRITVLVSSLALGRKETNMMTFLCDNNSHLGLPYMLAIAKIDRALVIPYCRGFAGPAHP